MDVCAKEVTNGITEFVESQVLCKYGVEMEAAAGNYPAKLF